MFLSRLELPLINKTIQRLLANPYKLHQVLTLACTADRNAKPGRILFRVEPHRAERPTIELLVLSDAAPNWDTSDVLEYLPTSSAQSKPIYPSMEIGKHYRFRLRANPTVKRGGKRRALLKDDELIAWLTRKLEQNGARLIGVTITTEGTTRGTKSGAQKQQELLFHSVLFDGSLAVTDNRALHDALFKGIGPAKAFGFGLLSLAPIA